MKLQIYMKSGHKITVKGVKDYSFKYEGNRIVAFSIEYYTFPFLRPHTKLNIASMDLSQIEAIVRTYYYLGWGR